VDVIVLDHHQVSQSAARAVALVNPQLTQNPEIQKLKNFNGIDVPAGLAFKLAHALLKPRTRNRPCPARLSSILKSLLDLVALGTNCGSRAGSPGENRILVTAGLEKLNTTQRPGIVALKHVAQSAGQARHARCRLPRLAPAP